MAAVYAYDAVTGTAYILQPAAHFRRQRPALFPVVAPAPTYFDGCIYAGQPDGTLYVYRLSGAGLRARRRCSCADVYAGSGNREPVTASPAVGLLADGTLTNDIVAFVPTTQNLYTVFLGARADLLQPIADSQLHDLQRQSRRLRLFNLTLDSDMIREGL